MGDSTQAEGPMTLLEARNRALIAWMEEVYDAPPHDDTVP